MWLFPLVFMLFAAAYWLKSRDPNYNKGPEVIQLLLFVAVLNPLFAIRYVVDDAGIFIGQTAATVVLLWGGFAFLRRATALQANRGHSEWRPRREDRSRIIRQWVLAPLTLLGILAGAFSLYVQDGSGVRAAAFALVPFVFFAGLLSAALAWHWRSLDAGLRETE